MTMSHKREKPPLEYGTGYSNNPGAGEILEAAVCGLEDALIKTIAAAYGKKEAARFALAMDVHFDRPNARLSKKAFEQLVKPPPPVS